MNRARRSAQSGALFFLSVLVVVPALAAAPKVPPPRLVFLDQDGRLDYDTDEHGNRVPDFSNCGYAGANQTLPAAPVRVVVAPKPGDSTARIQNALD